MALSEKLTAHTDPVLGSKQEDDNRRGGISNLPWFYFSKLVDGIPFGDSMLLNS